MPACIPSLSLFYSYTQAPGRSPLISFFLHQMAPPPLLLSPSRKHQRSSPHPLPFHLHGRPLLFPTFLSFSIKMECLDRGDDHRYCDRSQSDQQQCEPIVLRYHVVIATVLVQHVIISKVELSMSSL
ncbi:hypothetical protein SORBI_3004G134900 [Sorghum bicolor]|uniref:Uncharacterized protein n=1 Tax=Sorghum bicolor TaxID=4558 RepID=A0A194YPF5_SORBI|nr:hypothetical protein SORBI_3004G134900 [Sorghum bicolor]KXG30110.1 hypothetical protein SORBI_3004G134900 [Sorghum bicolor]